MSTIYVLEFVFSSPHSKKATRTLYSLPLNIISKQSIITDRKITFYGFLEASFLLNSLRLLLWELNSN